MKTTPSVTPWHCRCLPNLVTYCGAAASFGLLAIVTSAIEPNSIVCSAIATRSRATPDSSSSERFETKNQMPHEDFSVVYSGASLQADLLKSLLEGSGIPAFLKDEFLGRMYPYAIPGGVKVLVSNDDFDEARQIVE